MDDDVSKDVQTLLKMGKPDFLKEEAKDLVNYIELLEVERERVTDEAVRGSIVESIALINQAKEERLNQLEQRYITKELPKILKKHEKQITEITARIGKYYRELDAARDIVEKVIKKSPFPESYLITIIVQQIRKERKCTIGSSSVHITE
jgi:hypothetical protein